MEKTLTTKVETLRTTNHQTYELLANELTDHIPVKARKGTGRAKGNEEGSRARKIRAKTRPRKKDWR